jgi:cytochrome c-type biogenesis protein
MDWALLSWAFVAGAAATVNPCGIAMLPAYISYYLGRKEGRAGVGRGLQAGLLLALGTFGVFTLMGVVIAALGTAIAQLIPWLALLVALLLLVAGVMTLLGHAPSLNVGGTGQAPREGKPLSFVSFGVGYGLASLGCTLPIFMIVVSSVLRTTFLSGLLAFIAYGLGMGLVLTGISLAVALGKTAVLRWVRAAGPALKYVGGLGLLIAGSYLVTYNLRGLQFMASGQEDRWPFWLGLGAFLAALLTAAVLAARQRNRSREASHA